MPAPPSYDSAIADWFAKQEGETFPERLTISAERVQTLRYGENPHQQAAFYSDGSKRPGVATARMVQGKELSYNNIGDTEAAYECVAEFSEPAVVVVKHANPCGVAIGKDQYSAYLKAYACDPVSIFGGIVAVNRTLEAETADRPRQALPRSGDRARRHAGGAAPSSPARRTCACCWPAPCPIRRRPA